MNAAQLTDLHGTCRAAGIGVCSVTSATSRQLGDFSTFRPYSFMGRGQVTLLLPRLLLHGVAT